MKHLAASLLRSPPGGIICRAFSLKISPGILHCSLFAWFSQENFISKARAGDLLWFGIKITPRPWCKVLLRRFFDLKFFLLNISFWIMKWSPIPFLNQQNGTKYLYWWNYSRSISDRGIANFLSTEYCVAFFFIKNPACHPIHSRWTMGNRICR